MKRLLVLPVLAAGALALAAFAFASAGSSNKHTPTVKGGKLTFAVTTTDHGCNSDWATDTLKRTYKVHLREDGSYTVRREDRGRFVTLGGSSPSSDPCPGVVRRGKHGATVIAGIKGKLHGHGRNVHPERNLHCDLLGQRLHRSLLHPGCVLHVQSGVRRVPLQLQLHGSASTEARPSVPPLGRPWAGRRT